MDAREVFSQAEPSPTPQPAPSVEPTPEPIAQPIPNPEPVVPVAPEPPKQVDHFGKVLTETMEALKIIDPTGGLVDQVRQIRRDGIPYYPPNQPRQPNGQFAPQVNPPAQELTQPRYVGELTVDELLAMQTANISQQLTQAQQQAAYEATIRSEHQQCREKLDSLTAPRQTFDETGKPLFIPAIPKQELAAAEQEALAYRIDTSQPGGATAYTRLVLTLWNQNRLSKPGGLQTTPNPVAAQVATPAAGTPTVPEIKSPERKRQDEIVDRMIASERPSARQLFSK